MTIFLAGWTARVSPARAPLANARSELRSRHRLVLISPEFDVLVVQDRVQVRGFRHGLTSGEEACGADLIDEADGRVRKNCKETYQMLEPRMPRRLCPGRRTHLKRHIDFIVAVVGRHFVEYIKSVVDGARNVERRCTKSLTNH